LAGDAQEQDDLLVLERGGMVLAQSLEIARRLELFSNQAKRLGARSMSSEVTARR
jgi:hypothetical protein